MADNDRKIDEATQDTDITGIEKVPVSDNSTPKFATVSDIKDYVLKCLRQKTVGGSSVDMYGNYLYYVDGGDTYRISCVDFAEQVVQRLFDKGALTGEISGSEKIAVGLVEGQQKFENTITLSALVAYVRSCLSDMKCDVNGLPYDNSVAFTDEDCVAVCYGQQSGGSTVYHNVKRAVLRLASYVVGKIRANATASSAAIHDDDEVLTFEHTNNTLVRTKFSDIGIGKGDVMGPSSNSDNKIPQWNGANSKTLKDGLSVVESGTEDPITSTSTDAQVPTAAAVYQHVANAISLEGAVTGPSDTTENKIPQWDSSDRVLKDGLALATTMASTSAASSDAKVPSEKAVNDLLVSNKYAHVDSSGNKTAGYIPKWTGNGLEMNQGYQVVSTVGNPPSANKIPNEAAVLGAVALAGNVRGPSTNVNGYIPTWNGSNTKTLSNGLQLTTTIAFNSTDLQIPTAKAVHDINNRVDVDRTATYVPGYTILSGNLTNSALVIGPSDFTIHHSRNDIVSERYAIPTESVVKNITANAHYASEDELPYTEDSIGKIAFVDDATHYDYIYFCTGNSSIVRWYRTSGTLVGSQQFND